MSDDTAFITVNTPNNPTGAVYDAPLTTPAKKGLIGLLTLLALPSELKTGDPIGLGLHAGDTLAGFFGPTLHPLLEQPVPRNIHAVSPFSRQGRGSDGLSVCALSPPKVCPPDCRRTDLGRRNA